jgi:membrane protein
MPNKRIPLASALVGGIIAGTLYQLTQWAYIHFQVGVARYGAIYGSFAALPLFLIWLQTSWLVVLYGAEVAFAHLHRDSFEFEPDARRLSPFFRRSLAAAIMQLTQDRFRQGARAMTAAEFARTLDVPEFLIRELLCSMTDSELLNEVAPVEIAEARYLPGRSFEGWSPEAAAAAFDRGGINEPPFGRSDFLQKIKSRLESNAGRSPLSPPPHP